MNQLNLALDYTYPDCLILKIKDEEFLITNPDIIKNIAIKRKKIVIEWWMVNVLSQIESDSEHFIRLDEKIDEEMLEVEDEINLLHSWEKHNVEWEIADVLEVIESIKNIFNKLLNPDINAKKALYSAVDTQVYINEIIKEYNLDITFILEKKKKKLKSRGWFIDGELWWWVLLEDLKTEEWMSKLLELLAA